MRTPAEYHAFSLALAERLEKMQAANSWLALRLAMFADTKDLTMLKVQDPNDLILLSYLTHDDKEVQRRTRLAINLKLLNKCVPYRDRYERFSELSSWIFNVDQLESSNPKTLHLSRSSMLANRKSYERLFAVLEHTKNQYVIEYLVDKDPIWEENSTKEHIRRENLRIMQGVVELIRRTKATKFRFKGLGPLYWSEAQLTETINCLVDELCKIAQVDTLKRLEINLDYINSLEAVKKILQGITRSQIEVLQLTLESVRPSVIPVLRTLLKESKIKELVLFANAAKSEDNVAFLEALTVSNLERVGPIDLAIYRYEIDALVSLVTKSKLKFICFSDFNALPTDSQARLLEAINHSQTLEQIEVIPGRLKETSNVPYFNLIRSRKLVRLNLSVGSIEQDEIEQFFAAFKNSLVPHLDISLKEIDALHQNDPAAFFQFCESMRVSKTIKKICITIDDLSTQVRLSDRLEKLIENLPLGLNELIFDRLQIAGVTDALLTILAGRIKNFTLTNLQGIDFNGYIGQPIHKALPDLIEAIVQSRLPKLGLFPLNDFSKNILDPVILENTALIDFDGLGNKPVNPEIVAALHRNRELALIRSKLNALMSQLETKTDNMDALEAEIADVISENLETLSVWRHLPLQRVWDAGYQCLLELLQQFAEKIFATGDIMIDELLNLFSGVENSTLYFGYFNHTRNDVIDVYQSNHQDVISIPLNVMRNAFLKALPYTLDSNLNLVTFSKNEQKIVDSCLESAVRHNSNEQASVLSPSQRLALTQLMMIRLIKDRNVLHSSDYRFAEKIQLTHVIHALEIAGKLEDNILDPKQQVIVAEFMQTTQTLFGDSIELVDADLYHLNLYMQKLAARIAAEKTVIAIYNENKNLPNPELTEKFISVAELIFDHQGNMQVYSGEYLAMFDAFLFAVISQPDETFIGALDNVQRLAMLQYLLLRHWDAFKSNPTRSPNMLIADRFENTVEFIERINQHWIKYTSDLPVNLKPDSRIARLMKGCEKLAVKIKDDENDSIREKQNVKLFETTHSIDVQPVAIQQIEVLRHINVIIAARLKNISAALHIARLQGFKDRVQKVVNDAQNAGFPTAQQQSELSSVWDMVKNRIAELNLNDYDDDEKNILIQKIEHINSVLQIQEKTSGVYHGAFFRAASNPVNAENTLPNQNGESHVFK